MFRTNVEELKKELEERMAKLKELNDKLKLQTLSEELNRKINEKIKTAKEESCRKCVGSNKNKELDNRDDEFCTDPLMLIPPFGVDSSLLDND